MKEDDDLDDRLLKTISTPQQLNLLFKKGNYSSFCQPLIWFDC
jgi:hypothetical protein